MTPTPFLAALLWPGCWRDPSTAWLVALWTCAFGTTAALHLGSGSPVLLATVASLPLMAVAARRAPSLHHMRIGGPQAWQLMLVLWALPLTLFAPRLAQEITVIGLVPHGQTVVTARVPLAPQGGNLNQLAYLLLSLGVFAAARLLAGLAPVRTRLVATLLGLCGLHIALTAVQMLHLYAGLPNLLEPLMNAGWAIHSGGEVGGLQRLSGAFPEASSFAQFTLGLYAACLALCRSGTQAPKARLCAALLLLLLLLSTSSSALLGLVLLHLALLALALAASTKSNPRVGSAATLQLGWGAASVLAVALGLGLALLLSDAVATAAARVLDAVLLDKVDSSSARERGLWNRVAWEAFIDSRGLGVGVGSTRASSYALVLLSNVGLPGLLLFTGFLVRALGPALRPATQHDGTASSAAGHHAAALGALGLLAGACTSATVMDLGMFFYLLCGAASAAQPDTHAAAGRPPTAQPALPGMRHAC